MVVSNIRFTWPNFAVAYEATQSDIAWDSKMSNPVVDEDSVDVWSSLGGDYNYFDKTVMKAGFQLKTTLDDDTRAYYDYLVNT